VTELSLLVAKLDLPDSVIGHLMDKLSLIEYRLSHGVSEKIQIGSLVGAFVVARNMMQ
jgi:replication factor C subunit 3/5